MDASSNPLRVVFCSSGGLYEALVLRQLLACKNIEVCRIVRSSRTNTISQNFFTGAISHIKRSGLRYALYLFCATSLSDIFCKIKKVTPSKRVTIKTLTTKNINNQRGRQFVADCHPDLIISAFFNQKFSAETLSIPLKGGVNIHPSLLPMHKGVDPVVQCCLQGNPLGVTVHLMTPELDEGAVLAQKTLTFSKNASVFEISAGLFDHGATLLSEELSQLNKDFHADPQKEEGSYESWPKIEELKKLKRMGIPLMRIKDLSLFSEQC